MFQEIGCSFYIFFFFFSEYMLYLFQLRDFIESRIENIVSLVLIMICLFFQKKKCQTWIKDMTKIYSHVHKNYPLPYSTLLYISYLSLSSTKKICFNYANFAFIFHRTLS